MKKLQPREVKPQITQLVTDTAEMKTQQLCSKKIHYFAPQFIDEEAEKQSSTNLSKTTELMKWQKQDPNPDLSDFKVYVLKHYANCY